MVIDVHDFQKQVLDQSRRLPAVVDFWAEWCGPCKAFSPILEQEASLNEDRWFLAKVNIDEHQELAKALRITSIPTVAMIYQEKVLASFMGLITAPDFRKWVEENYPDLRDKSALMNAIDFWQKDQPEKAILLLESFLNQYPDDGQVRALFALWICLDQPEKAISLTNDIFEDAPYYDDALAVRRLVKAISRHQTVDQIQESPGKAYLISALHALHHRKTEIALQQFIESLYRDKHLEDGLALQTGVALFRYWGNAHPLTLKYRRLFDMALY